MRSADQHHQYDHQRSLVDRRKASRRRRDVHFVTGVDEDAVRGCGLLEPIAYICLKSAIARQEVESCFPAKLKGRIGQASSPLVIHTVSRLLPSSANTESISVAPIAGKHQSVFLTFPTVVRHTCLSPTAWFLPVVHGQVSSHRDVRLTQVGSPSNHRGG